MINVFALQTEILKWANIVQDEITCDVTQHYAHQFSQPGQTKSRSRTTRIVSNHTDMSERTKTMSYHGDRGKQMVSFGGRFNWEVLVAVFASTHWGRDKIAAIFQTTFSKAFSWMWIY